MVEIHSLTQPEPKELTDLCREAAKACPSAKERREHPETVPRVTFNFPLSEEREAALEMIKTGEVDQDKLAKILESRDFVTQDAGRWLQGHQYAQRSEAQDKDTTTLRKWLLTSPKAYLATPDTEAVLHQVGRIGEMAKELKERYGDDFIGVIVVGSVAKGFFKGGESDIDMIVLGRDEQIQADATQIAQRLDLPLCEGFSYTEEGKPSIRYIGIGERGKFKAVGGAKLINERVQLAQDVGLLFQGLFFGDAAKLLRLQLTAMEEINEPMWDYIRGEVIKFHQIELFFEPRRFGDIERSEQVEMEEAIALLRVPPRYEETKKILIERLKRLERKQARTAQN